MSLFCFDVWKCKGASAKAVTIVMIVLRIEFE